jgi:hypothetical protein
MEQVTKTAFFAAIGKQNVHPSIVGNWPYTSVFKTPGGHVVGQIVSVVPEGKALAVSTYFLA